MRRFPAPWTVEAIEGGFKVIDANWQAIAYVYDHADKRDAETAKSRTLDEARRMGQGGGGHCIGQGELQPAWSDTARTTGR